MFGYNLSYNFKMIRTFFLLRLWIFFAIFSVELERDILFSLISTLIWHDMTWRWCNNFIIDKLSMNEWLSSQLRLSFLSEFVDNLLSVVEWMQCFNKQENESLDERMKDQLNEQMYERFHNTWLVRGSFMISNTHIEHT